MATSLKMYVPTHPGRIGSAPIDQYHNPIEDKAGAFLSTFQAGEYFSKRTFPKVGGGNTYTAGDWNVTSTGTGAAQALAVTTGSGILLTTGSTSTFYSGLQSKHVLTPLVGKVYAFRALVQVSHATQIGFNLGFANVQAGPTATEYTDFIGFRKAPTVASIYGTVVGNSGSVTQTASSLKTPVAATEYDLSFYVYLGATAAACYGSFFVDGTETVMTSTLLTEVVKFLTTPPTDWGLTLFCTGTSGNNPTCTITSCIAQGDR